MSIVREALVKSVRTSPPLIPPVRHYGYSHQWLRGAERRTKETPHEKQPSVDGSKLEIPLIVSLLHFRDMVEQPPKLDASEISREWQAGLVSQGIDSVFGLAREFAHGAGRAGVGPDDDIVECLSGAFVPDDGRFTLVRDTYTRS
jgi:hypothetical protein